jgi:hypothetical protein
MRSAVDRVSNMEGRLDAECEAYVDGLSAHVTFQLGHSPPGTRAAVSDISFHFPLWFAPCGPIRRNQYDVDTRKPGALRPQQAALPE